MMSDTKPLILVVDDTEANRYAIARVLRNEGCRIHEAATGKDALDVAAKIKPDLITLDIHLPDMLGFEVCRKLKSDPATAHIPVLQVSASYITSKDKIQGLEGGADSYLTHPFEAPVLVATVRALLRFRALNEKLIRNEETYRVVLDKAPIYVSTCDNELRVTWLHKVAAGFTEEDLIGRRDDEVFDKEKTRQVMAMKSRVLATGKGEREVLEGIINGCESVWDVSVEAMHDIDGRISGVTLAALDIAARRREEIELQEAKRVAEAANRAKSQFLANISHEIRTPLGVILGLGDLLLEADPERAERQNYLGVIKRNAELLTKLIDEILDLSKIEADRMNIETLMFDVRAVLEDVMSLLQIRAREKGLALQLRISPQVPNTIESDPTRLRQILINLVGNALKFTERGEVTVEVSPVVLPREGELLELAITVTDTGLGISEVERGKLFEAFSQADASTTRKYGGTGLGLMLSKRLAKTLSGDLELAESTPGKGSTFRLVIAAGLYREARRAKGVDRNATPASSLRPSALEGMRVLLVEDSPDNQMMVTRFLNMAGASVELADNGEVGVEKALGAKFDVVLMDIQMPKLDGYGAVRELRSRGYTLPVIALTAHALRGERERCLDAGFSDYLTKPLKRQQLVETLEPLR